MSPKLEIKTEFIQSEKSGVSLIEDIWQTPATYLINRLGRTPQVRLIGDRYYPEYLQTIVVLEDDPEGLLDKIFSIEVEMRKKFKNINFDLRVCVITSEEEIEKMKQGLLIRYERV